MTTKRPTRAQIYTALLAVLIIAFLGGTTGWYLASESAQQDYLTNILLSFCAGLLVSLVFTFIIQNILAQQSTVEMVKHQQIATTTGLYERFHSPEMIDIRCRLDRVLESLNGSSESLSEIHNRLYVESKDPEVEKDWVALSAMLHFYENIADLIERDLIDKATSIANFSKYFRWLSDNPALSASIQRSKDNGEEWFFISRFEYLKKVGF